MRYKKGNAVSERVVAALLLTGICVGVVFVSKNALAEGHQSFNNAQGVNRAIHTKPVGYVEVTGTGTMSISDLPDQGGTFGDKPTFYVGGHVGHQTIDAGLQYESAPTGGRDAGWSAFISWNGMDHPYAKLRVLDADGTEDSWRGTVGPKPITSTITFKFIKLASGDVVASVTIGAIAQGLGPNTLATNDGTFFYNIYGNPGTHIVKKSKEHPIPHHTAPWKGAVITTGSLATADVKRVVGMTRSSGGNQDDGSKLICTWSQCEVTKLDASSPSWDSSITDQGDGRTGYDAPGNGSSDAKDGMHEYKVDFPNLTVSSEDARTNSAKSKQAKQGDVSRYTTETVVINLRFPGTRGKGKEKTID